ncbi:hypothetical protein GCM10023318_09520 [Nocardia callitridis]|uniref:DNA-directed DNA polymerase n=1 Tax=Nocardia callitridis TaxID=648753 RepID=A0ABP9JV06_9NOCA
MGQEHVTDPLSIALDTGRISHAYLFSGPRGCGKTSSARILARSLNCVEGPTSTPCGVCASCVALGPGGTGNLDVIELDAASHGGVDDTRELRDRAFYAPAESRYRVFIVDEAHMVTTAGFNALLKIVEEPPAHLIFIFATTEPEKVLPTIRSRTHHYPFRLLPPATMRGLLGKICEQEHVPVEEAVYPLVIRAGGGSPRDSLSVLDQLLAGAGPEGVTYPRAVSLLGVTDVALIDDAIEALAAGDGAALFGTVDRVMEAGHDPRRFAVDLLERMRDLILLRAVPDAAERGLVSGPGDVLDRMRAQAQRLGPATLTRYAELMHEGLGEMRGATAPRLLLEVVCARMLLPAVSETESATLQRLERLERGLADGTFSAASAGTATAQGGSAAATVGSPTAAEPDVPSGPPRRRGAEALAAMRRENPPSAAGRSESEPTQGSSGRGAEGAEVAGANQAHAGPPVRTVDAQGSGAQEPAAAVAYAAESSAAESNSSSRDSAAAPARGSDAATVPARGNAQGGATTGADSHEGSAPVRAEASDSRTTEAGRGGNSAGSSAATGSSSPRAGRDQGSDPASPTSRTPDMPPPESEATHDGTTGPSSDVQGADANAAGQVAGPGAEAEGPNGHAVDDMSGSRSPDPNTHVSDAPDRSGAHADAGGTSSPDPQGVVGPTVRVPEESGAPDSDGPRSGSGDGQRISDAPHSDAAGGLETGAANEPEQGAPQRESDPSPAAVGLGTDTATGPEDAAAHGESDARTAAVGADVTPTPAEEAAPVTESTGDLVREVEAAWADIRAKVREVGGAAVHAMLAGGSVLRVEGAGPGAVIVFGHQHAPLAQRLSTPQNLAAMRTAVGAVVGGDREVRWEVGGGTPRQAPPPKTTARQGREASGQSAPRYSRPSQAKNAGGGGSGGNGAGQRPDARPSRDDDIPPPDYPDLPDDPGPSDFTPQEPAQVGGNDPEAGGDWETKRPLGPATPEEEQEMLAAAADPVAPEDRRDPDEVAMELLKSELGATQLNG